MRRQRDAAIHDSSREVGVVGLRDQLKAVTD
jgi:hypothetical protein